MFYASFRLSSRWGSTFWFSGIRMIWATYWFLGAIPAAGGRAGPFILLWSGLVPVVLSTLVAGILGSTLGYSISRPGGTNSYWIAGLKGFLIQHLTTILYLPAAVAIKSLTAGDYFLPSLYLSYIVSIAGLPIHTLLGIVTGVLYFYLAVRRPGRQMADVQ